MRLEIFLDKQGKPRIRLRAKNGRILMSSEAYSRKDKALKTAISIRDHIDTLSTDILDLTIKQEK